MYWKRLAQRELIAGFDRAEPIEKQESKERRFAQVESSALVARYVDERLKKRLIAASLS